MTKYELLQSINNNEIQDSVIREKQGWQFDIPYKCVIANGCPNDSTLSLDIAISTSEDDEIFQVETFKFKLFGPGRHFLDEFLEIAFPDEKGELKLSTIIGKSFIGQVVEKDGYTNIRALSSCDNPVIEEDYDDDFDEDFDLDFDDDEDE